MKPLEFKYKKLYYEPKFYDEALGYKISEVIAYQVFPKGDYRDSNYTLNRASSLKIESKSNMNSNIQFYDNGSIYLIILEQDPLMPIYVPSCQFEQFKQAVIEYNKKYCEQPDVKVLDDLIEHCKKCSEKWQSEDIDVQIQYERTINTLQGYKQTLESDYFEEVTNE